MNVYHVVEVVLESQKRSYKLWKMHSNKLPCFNKIITHGKYCGNPDEKYTKHFNRLNFNFLWNKKKYYSMMSKGKLAP